MKTDRLRASGSSMFVKCVTSPVDSYAKGSGSRYFGKPGGRPSKYLPDCVSTPVRGWPLGLASTTPMALASAPPRVSELQDRRIHEHEWISFSVSNERCGVVSNRPCFRQNALVRMSRTRPFGRLEPAPAAARISPASFPTEILVFICKPPFRPDSLPSLRSRRPTAS